MPYRNPLMYTLVARGPPAPILPLAEYFENENDGGDFELKAEKYIHKLSTSNNNYTTSFKSGNLFFNYMVYDGFTYCVVTQENERGVNHLDYLKHLKNKFVSKYGCGEEAKSAPAYGLNDEFRPMLKNLWLNYRVYYEDPVEKLARERKNEEMQQRLKEKNEREMKERIRKENSWPQRCKRLILKSNSKLKQYINGCGSSAVAKSQ